MFHAVVISPARLTTTLAAAAAAVRRHQPPRILNSQNKNEQERRGSKSSSVGFGGKKKEAQWQCVQNCGACCKLQKGPTFPSPEDIFEDPSDIELYNSLIGTDGWCIHFDKATRKCSTYADRPYFCRVEPDVFYTLYGIERKKFNKEACSSCIDTIKSVHGSSSQELDNFNNAIWKDCS